MRKRALTYPAGQPADRDPLGERPRFVPPRITTVPLTASPSEGHAASTATDAAGTMQSYSPCTWSLQFTRYPLLTF